MADISMCNGKDCKNKAKCYRYTAPPNEYWQAYAMYDLLRIESEGCEYFVDNSGYTNVPLEDIK